MKVYSDFDRDLSVKNYSTFGWTNDEKLEAKNNPLYYNELNDKRIKNDVSAQLKSNGYQFDLENPQLKLHYHIILEDRSVINPEPFGSYGRNWVDRSMNMHEFREGTLIIDLMDTKTNNLVWRGWAVDFLDEDKPDQIGDQLNNAIKKIFQKFPKH
ncbi:MAG TPA: DUF4136 domain-containing protein [Cyclobacteriaceae bacterium]|jgi:hypothetical protein|nr:DUF4136 domain-containing protein [Cyclobacteriaceae bacterium]